MALVKLNDEYVPIVGVDFYGNDIRGFSSTFQDCVSACDNTTECGVIAMIVNPFPITANSEVLCYLKPNTNIDWSFNDGNQSYVMPKTTVSGIHSMFACVPCVSGEVLCKMMILVTIYYRLLLPAGIVEVHHLPHRFEYILSC